MLYREAIQLQRLRPRVHINVMTITRCAQNCTIDICLLVLFSHKSGMRNGMECGMEYGTDYGTHLVYHKHANYVAMPINYPLPIQRMK